MGSIEEAKKFLGESLEIDGDFVESKKKLALVHYRERNYTEAERLILDAIELHQDYPDLHKILGDIRLERGEPQSARDAYQESLALNNDYADAVFGFVVALRRDGNGRDADALLRGFISRHPSNLLARSLLTVEKMKLPDA